MSSQYLGHNALLEVAVFSIANITIIVVFKFLSSPAFPSLSHHRLTWVIGQAGLWQVKQIQPGRVAQNRKRYNLDT